MGWGDWLTNVFLLLYLSLKVILKGYCLRPLYIYLPNDISLYNFGNYFSQQLQSIVCDLVDVNLLVEYFLFRNEQLVDH